MMQYNDINIPTTNDNNTTTKTLWFIVVNTLYFLYINFRNDLLKKAHYSQFTDEEIAVKQFIPDYRDRELYLVFLILL